MRPRSRPRLIVKLFSILSVALLFTNVALFVAYESVELDERRTLLLQTGEQQLTNQKRLLAQPMWDVDVEMVQLIAQSLIDMQEIAAVQILDEDQMVLVALGDWNAEIDKQYQVRAKISLPVQGLQEPVGEIEIQLDQNYIYHDVVAHATEFVVSAFVILAVLLLVFLMLYHFTIGQPLARLIRSIQAFNATDTTDPVVWDVNDEMGDVVGAYNRMIAARKQAKVSLKASEQRFRDIILASADWVWEVDANARYIYASDNVFNLLGFRSEEIMGKTPFDLMPPEEAERVGDIFSSIIARKEAFRDLKNVNCHRDGSLRTLLTSGVPILGVDGELLGYRGMDRDITEREETELTLRRAHKMEAVGQLTGGIAHDFNNILAIIIGNLDLLKRQVTDGNALTRIETITKSANRATDLIKKLLGFARQQSAKQVHTNIQHVIQDMENLIARSLTPEISLEQNFAEDLWQTDIDPGDFQDALLNLAINSRDAMPDGGQLTLDVRNCTLDAGFCEVNPGAIPGEYVQLVVSDTGMGISHEDKERIFEPFFTTKLQGTGLGMAMVYGFTKRSKGYIQIFSEPDIGTAIHLYLPKAEGMEQLLESSPRSVEHLPRGSETILVVDDEEELLKLARQSLQALGYRVLTANSGRHAIERLAEEPDIDLLFSDVVMPGGMNGYELSEQATYTHPQIKVLLTSGYTGKAKVHSGQERFAANLLSKPYSQGELAQKVRTLLGKLNMSETN